MNLMDLFIKIGLDDQATPLLGKISDSFKSGLATAAKIGTTAVVAAGTALIGVTKSALDATGELEQNIGGSEAVFGKYAKNVQELAEDAYGKMGVSASDFLATANKMGSLMQGSGISIEDSMKMSTEAMQRAADVASIMGIDVGSAMESIAGAAKGNFTMMDNLGVAMDATTIESYALSKGITTAYKEMDNATKIGLAMNMFLEKTEYATGNYVKENETLAGSMTTLQESWGNFLSGAGDMDQVLDSVGGAGEAVVRTLGDVIPRIGDGIETVAQSIGEKVPGIIENVSANLPDLVNTVAEKFGEGVNQFVTNLPTTFSNLLGSASGLIETFSTVGVDFINGMVGGITDSIPDFIAGLPDIIGEFGGFIATNAPKLVDAGMEIMTNLASGLADAVSELTD
jgi:phage-related protein